MNTFKGILFYFIGLIFSVVLACEPQNIQDIEYHFQSLEKNIANLGSSNMSYEGIVLLDNNNEITYNYAKNCVAKEDEKIKSLDNINQQIKKLPSQQFIQARLLGIDEQLCQHQTRKVLCESLKIKAHEFTALSKDALSQYRIRAKMPNLIESINAYQAKQLIFTHVSNIQEYLNLDRFTSSQLKIVVKIYFFSTLLGAIGFSLIGFVEKKAHNFVFKQIAHAFKYVVLFFLPVISVLVKSNDFAMGMIRKPMLIYILMFAQLVIKVIIFLQLFYRLIIRNRSEKLFGFFYHRMNYFSFWIVCQYAIYDIIRGCFLEAKVVNFVSQLGIMFFSPILFLLGFSTLKPWIDFYYTSLSVTSKAYYVKAYTFFLALVCFLQIVLSFKGYNELAFHLPMVCTVFILFFLFFKLVFFILNYIQHQLESSNSIWSKKINQILGKGTNLFLLEFRLLFNFLFIVIAVLVFKRFFQSWGLPPVFLSYIQQLIFQGFVFGDLKIQPYFFMKVLLIVLLINAIGTLFAKIWLSQRSLEDDKKFTMSFLIHSGIYILSLVVALEMLGVDNAQISLIIGALSVGIGIALRGLISDFLAGLYLVFQKPVYIGDYIEINGVEGQVKKISMFTTELSTPSSTIVYVPNEEFLRKNVVNKSKLKKIIPCKLEFSIKNFNDFDVARHIILEVLAKYPDIYNKEGLQPQILFHQVKDAKASGYTLKLSLHISNISQTDAIIASIQLETLKLFQERGVETI